MGKTVLTETHLNKIIPYMNRMLFHVLAYYILDDTFPLETHKILQHYQKMCNRQFYNIDTVCVYVETKCTLLVNLHKAYITQINTHFRDT